MSEYFLGVDVGGTNVVVGLVDSSGCVVARSSEPSRVELGPKNLIERIAACCRKLIAQAVESADQVKGIGIATPGPLSVSQGKIIRAANLPGFDNFPVRGELSRTLNIPAVFDNDANAACWGEFWAGAGKDVADMVMFTLGTGIGGGIVCEGELLHGSEDNGAELGHMIVQPGGRACNCGQLGCIEAYASANQTAARAQEALEQGRPSSLQEVLRQNKRVSCKNVFDHGKAGDQLALEIIDETARILAVACINMRHITEPQLVVLAGGMINAGTILTEKVNHFYHEMIWSLKSEPMDIALAQLGQDAGVIGAAGLALHAWQRQTLVPVGI